MPISQLTVLALYGELRSLIIAIEQVHQDSLNLETKQPLRGLVAERNHQIAELCERARRSEAAAIETILQDAPAIKINPLTGEAS